MSNGPTNWFFSWNTEGARMAPAFEEANSRELRPRQQRSDRSSGAKEMNEATSDSEARGRNPCLPTRRPSTAADFVLLPSRRCLPASPPVYVSANRRSNLCPIASVFFFKHVLKRDGIYLSLCLSVKINLRHARLRRPAICQQTNFCDANLGRDNLNGRTSLKSADLTGAILDGTILSDVVYDDVTKFLPVLICASTD